MRVSRKRAQSGQKSPMEEPYKAASPRKTFSKSECKGKGKSNSRSMEDLVLPWRVMHVEAAVWARRALVPPVGFGVQV